MATKGTTTGRIPLPQMAMLAVGGFLALLVSPGCGGDGAPRQAKSADAPPAAAGAAPAAAQAQPAPRHDLEVFVDELPAKPYMVITSFRYPAPSSAGEQMGYIKQRARSEGGDAVVVRVVSGSLGRTDTEDRPLIEATVIAWR
jgi:hypothetical protein